MDWGEGLRTALALGLSPEAFWRLSVREWRLLTGPASASAPLSRSELEALALRWPDKEPVND